MDRRDFLRRSQAAGIGAAAGLTLLSNPASVRAAPANERLSIAVVGLRNRGQVLATAFAQRPDCRVSYLCDVDRSLLDSRADSVAKVQGGKAPKTATDFRKALDDATVDALVIATPDHWHCLATAWACRAGKDVFVAAPLSQNAAEGRTAVEAARKHKRIVSVDLAARSSHYGTRAKNYIAAGKLGKIHFCRVYEQSGQNNFLAVPDSIAPPGLDWNSWNGPAPMTAYNVNRENNWTGYWQYSSGEIAVKGVHQLDLARWLCGLDYPKSVYAQGGRFDAPGGNETPDTFVATYEFDALIMTFELTLYTPYMTRVSTAVRNGDVFPHWPQCGSRIEIYGSEGVMIIGPHGAGFQVFARPRREQPTLIDRSYGKPVDPDHTQNFVDSIRTRQPPSADVEEGHRSALLVHYATMSYRTGGQKLHVDAKTEAVDNVEAMKLFRREDRKPWVAG